MDLFLEKSTDLLEIKDKLLNTYLAFLDTNIKLQFSTSLPVPSLKLLKISTLLKTEYSRLLGLEFSQWTRETIDFLCCHSLFMFLFAGSVALKNVADELMCYLEQHISSGNNNNSRDSKTTNLDYSDALKYILVLTKMDVARRRGEQFSYYKSLLIRCVKLSPNDDVINALFMDVKKNGMNSLESRRVFEQSLSTNKQKEYSLITWLHYLMYEEHRLLSISVIPDQEKVRPVLCYSFP